MHIVSFKEVGPPFTPQEIKRLRRQNMDLCRKMGQPVVFRHMWNQEDVIEGIARQCPACYDTAYDQVRNDCPVCFGFGFASVEETDDPNIWINEEGQLINTTSPQTGWIRAPKYGGFGPSILTWMVEPDVAVDVYRINEQGVMIQTYDAQGVAPWWPKLGDNDLCINVRLAPNDFSIIETGDRFQLKLVQQVTVRGFGKMGRPQGGQAYMVAQTFQMSKAPTNSSLYDVPLNIEYKDKKTISGTAVISGVEQYN